MGLYGLHRPYGPLTHIYTNSPPSSLDYQRSGVQDWPTKKETHTQGPPQPQLATGYVEVGPKLREGRGGKTLGEDVSELGGGRYMKNPNITNSHSVSNEMQVNLHMLRPLMLNRVGGEVQGTDVVAVDECALGKGLWSSAKSCRSQDASATPLATARYSASALERETTGCRLDDQEIRLPPRKTT
jgi:hypothetical protein